VLFDSSVGRPVAAKPDNTQWVSIMKCISVDRAVKPYLIFVGKAPDDHMFPQQTELPDVIWAFSPKGWTDNKLAVDWLRRIFVPKTSRQGKRSILILRNHESHTTGEFQYYCLLHDIHPSYLPAHASHKLQPLDVGAFSPSEKAYGRAVREHAPTGLATLDRAAFAHLYVQARQQAFTERNIRAGWK
jgi:DDE superfamily endonuclease